MKLVLATNLHFIFTHLKYITLDTNCNSNSKYHCLRRRISQPMPINSPAGECRCELLVRVKEKVLLRRSKEFHKRSADERRRSERLMLSVQSGVNPMRHLTVSFEMSLANDFEGAIAYGQTLRDQISKDRECKRRNYASGYRNR